MQTKTIQKVISTKLNEWLETITDVELRKELKLNILVSGGSIASMLLNEPVNDYDVYIKDKVVLEKLVIYYTKNYSLQILRGWEKANLLKSYEEGILSFDPEYKNQYIVALNNLKDEQIKLFIANTGGLKCNEAATDEEKKKYIPLYFSPNAISLSSQLQIVIRFYGDDVAIHKTFDFIHATNYFTFEKGLVLNKEALESLLTKQLKYQGSQYPLTSIIRMKKFIKRNFGINAGEILKIMFQISELDLKNPDVLEEQLIGVDVAYFDTLIRALRTVDKDTITSEYLNTIIDRVFNQSEEV